MLKLKLRDIAYAMGHEAASGQLICPFRRVDLVYAFAKGFTDGLAVATISKDLVGDDVEPEYE